MKTQKSFFEQNGGTYTQVGDVLLPNLTIGEDGQQPIGKFGRMRKRYLKERHPVLYSELLLSGKVGFAVRTAYLDENWYAMADMICYPIAINGTELADADAFLDYMKDKTVHESDRQTMMDEDCLDMFVNGQGICMGSGQVWLNAPNYMTDAEPQLQIIAISGIVDR